MKRFVVVGWNSIDKRMEYYNVGGNISGWREDVSDATIFTPELYNHCWNKWIPKEDNFHDKIYKMEVNFGKVEMTNDET